LNQLYTGDQIASHYVYAQNYTYLWCVLLYSTGLPILYPFACIFYFVLYWVYKWLLLKFYARTTRFNQDIPIKSVQWIKIGIALHLAAGSLMLSNNRFFPHEEKEEGPSAFGGYSAKVDIGTDDETFFGVEYVKRLAKGEQGSVYLAFICLLGAFLILKYTVLSWSIDLCIGLYRCLAKCCKCAKKHEVRSKDIYLEYTVLALENMYIKAMKDIEEFREDPADGKNMVGVRFPEETSFAQDAIEKIFNDRKRQVEHVIDDHLIHLHGLDKLGEFEELTYSQKLRYLMLNQANLDKSQRVRMIDITQSYNIHDSSQYSLSKKLEDILDDNKDYELLEEDIISPIK